jgi:hypothetical protein
MIRQLTSPALCAVAMAAVLTSVGCDGEGPEPSAMVMQPGEPATRPAETAPPEEVADIPVYISIDGEPYEFPPAKLYLKRTGNRVRARLLSDDPPEALARDWSGDSFFFEMDLELPGQEQIATIDEAAVSGSVPTKDLEAAEWVFHSETSERTPTKSGIFLGGHSHLQPLSVSVLFDQVDEKTVMVTLEGVFADFDLARPTEMTARRQVRVQAALPADAISY